jgi:putative CocE/NonD family hydrolase
LSLRGRDASEGEFLPFADEAADGGAALRWIAGQPELAGPIVVLGLGYAAFTAWAAASAEPDRVTAVAAGFGARDPHAWLHRGGVLQLETALALAARLDGREGIEPADLDLARAGRHLPEDDCDRVAVRELAAFRAWRAHPERDAWWEARTPALPRPPRALFLGGWYDAALEASLADHASLTAHAEQSDAALPALVLGPWGAAPTPERRRLRDTSPLAVVASAVSRFVAHAVGEPAARDVVTRVFVVGAGWRDGRPWPPPRTEPRTWHLHSGGAANSCDGDGRLADAAPGDHPPDRFVADPADAVPSLGGVAWHGLAGPVDQQVVEERGDVLCFTGDALAGALELAGSASATLFVESGAVPFDVCAKLVSVASDGAARWLAEGIARRREGGACTVDLGTVAARLVAGERLRLEVSGSSRPRFARCAERTGVAHCTVHHDGVRASTLTIEVAGS